jgi:predicted dienelactone hydrolase
VQRQHRHDIAGVKLDRIDIALSNHTCRDQHDGDDHAHDDGPEAHARAESEAPGSPFAVGKHTVTFVDRRRLVDIPGRGPGARTLVTIVRYPAVGPARRTDVTSAPPARAAGPFPLIVFGHGFAVTPHPYAALLQAWARAGYVVAAPIFPLENAHAPGGPNESDLVNEPGDVSVVISGMHDASRVRGGFFSGLVDRHRVAVGGQSDGRARGRV